MQVSSNIFGRLLIVLLLAGGSSLTLPEILWATPQPRQLAQVTPGSVTGQLDETSQTLEDGAYFAVHSYEGTAGEIVTLELVSEDFDTFIFLVSPTGELLRRDDNSGDGTNAQFTIELPETGTYQIGVISNIPGEIGQYTLSLRLASAAEQAQQRAIHLNQQAFERYQQGRYEEAESFLQQSLEILRGQLGERHPDVATNLNNLAGLYQVQGRYGEAETLFQQALEIYQEQLGKHHPDVATNLSNLAGLYQVQGRYGEAETLFQQALEIQREQLEEHDPNFATSLNNLANLHRLQGRYGEAETLFQQALEIYQEQLGKHHPDVATSLNNLAALYQVQGRYGEAEPLFQQALEIRREHLGEHHPILATSLNNLAVLYTDQGYYREAEPLFQQALEIQREQLGEHHPDVATSLNNLALLYHEQGRFGEAEPLFQQALEIRREHLGEHYPDVATSLNNLAGLYDAQGRHGEAIPYLKAGLEIEEWNLELNLVTLTETQRQAYAATIAHTTDRAVSLSLQANDAAPDAQPLALTTLLRRKGRVLDTGTNSLQVLRQNLTPADQVTLDEFTTVRQQLATLTFNPPADLPPEQYRSQLAQLEAQAADLEKTLAQRSAVFRAETEPVEIAAVQAQIPANGVLIEFTRYRPFNAANPTNFWGNDRYAVYLLFPDGRIEAIDLGDAAEIDAAVQSFTRLLQDRSTDLKRTGAAPRIRPGVVEQVTGDIKTLVFDPIAPYLQDTKHLLISPDGQLNLLPFEALQPETGGDYLVQQYQISYLNSGRDLLKFNLTEPSRNPAVIVANPDYDTATDALSRSLGEGQEERATGVAGRRSTELSQLQVGPLPGTAAEARAIEPLLPNATFLTEGQATENVLKTVQSPRILHIATHGFFLADVEPPIAGGSSGLGAITSDNSLASAAPVGRPIENPLLRSGLALAGFNTRTSGNEDGVFTALEAANLNLFGTQLVVLSACDTGLGDIASGEGVYGLRRAFSIAGAETQLMSLWQVSDFGTQSLMARYYENLTDGMGRSEALREVQLEMIAEGGQYSHPYYWAAFILAGNWQPLD
ncbi:MAG: tetratricopeptide repeat protein [Leptolyngbya sp. SIO1E4]|nr:tetratricopeptide repeat protein [Leptolyngbya sp. SIO1E4]